MDNADHPTGSAHSPSSVCVLNLNHGTLTPRSSGHKRFQTTSPAPSKCYSDNMNLLDSDYQDENVFFPSSSESRSDELDVQGKGWCAKTEAHRDASLVESKPKSVEDALDELLDEQHFIAPLPSSDGATASMPLLTTRRVKSRKFVAKPSPFPTLSGRNQKWGSYPPKELERRISWKTLGAKAVIEIAQSPENLEKLVRLCRKVNIVPEGKPREGKNLVVLDLDGTIMDLAAFKAKKKKVGPGNAHEWTRPFLHQFLQVIAPYYDFCFWSQTWMSALRKKLECMGIIGTNRCVEYPVVLLLDMTSMINIMSSPGSDSYSRKDEVKPLGRIFSRFPEYFSAANTIHVDDLRRNFMMNAESGLAVKCYKDSRTTAENDRELLFVAKYLLQLTLAPDFQVLQHAKFRTSSLPLPPDAVDPLSSGAKAAAPTRTEQ